MMAATGLAAVAGLVLVVALVSRSGRDQEPAASGSGLIVQTGRDGAVKLRADRPLDCFVGGRLVGQRTVAECARRNGVAPGALDVGLGGAGQLVAGAVQGGSTGGVDLAGRAAQPSPPVVGQPSTETLSAAAAGVADCAHFADDGWVRVADQSTLFGCARTLFDGQCLAQGVVSRGRWGDRVLRLAEGRVEASAPGSPYQLIAVQADGCVVAPPPPAGAG